MFVLLHSATPRMKLWKHLIWNFILNKKCLLMHNHQTTCLSSSESLGLTSYRKNAESAKCYKIALEKVNVLMWKMDFWNQLFENNENGWKQSNIFAKTSS